MADFQVPDKNLLTSVDRSADSFLIYDNSALQLKRTNVDYALDLTSHPVGINDVQTLTNKTVTAPAISSPVLSGTITGTYTIGGTPTFPSSVVTLTGSQSLTNKTLTSPTINNAVIANPTLTVDTISEYTSAAGVTIDGLLIKDSKLASANSVVASNITAGILTNSMLSTTAGELGGSWQSWTPTWTNLTVGNGTNASVYTRVGKVIIARIQFTLGTTSSISGSPQFTLPVTAQTFLNSGGGTLANGWANYVDSGNSTNIGMVEILTTTSGQLLAVSATGTYIARTGISSTVPFTWGTGDYITGTIIYEAA